MTNEKEGLESWNRLRKEMIAILHPKLKVLMQKKKIEVEFMRQLLDCTRLSSKYQAPSTSKKHLSSRNWLWQDKWIALSGLCLKYKVPCWHRFWHKSLPRGHICWCNLKNWTKLIMIVKNKFQKLIQQDHDQEESSISLERNMISCLMKIWLVFIEICQICSYICQWGFRQHIELKSCKKYLHWNKDTLNN